MLMTTRFKRYLVETETPFSFSCSLFGLKQQSYKDLTPNNMKKYIVWIPINGIKSVVLKGFFQNLYHLETAYHVFTIDEHRSILTDYHKFVIVDENRMGTLYFFNETDASMVRTLAQDRDWYTESEENSYKYGSMFLFL